MADSTAEASDQSTSTIESLKALIREAEQALGGSGDQNEDIQALRERLRDVLSDGRGAFGNITAAVRRQAARADDTIRSNPYRTIGIATGVGLLAGFLIARSSSSDS